MSKCVNCQIDHQGVGKHPNHPTELSLVVMMFWLILIVLSLTAIVLQGK